MSFYDELREATERERTALLSIPQIQAGVQGSISLHTYIAFLTQAYHHVKHTVPLLMACGARLPQEPRWLRDAIVDYIAEEKGHEEWILNDIAACDADAEAVRYGTPAPETELMVAYAYDTINRVNPLGFFGMVLVLEGTSIALATQAAHAIQENLKLPKQAFSYLSSHGALDIEHMEFFENWMNKMEQREDCDAIIHSARMIYRLYGDVFLSLPM